MIKTEAYNESKQFLGLTKKNGVKASKLYTQKPLGFFSVSRNLAAYRTNQEGVLELMGVNVPRIDYPITILEPARTNLLLRSQEFNNASWNKDGVTVTANTTNAPDGTLTADLMIPAATNAFHGVNQTFSFVSGTSYVLSYYVKSNGYNFVQILLGSAISIFSYCNFNLSTGAKNNQGFVNSNIETLSNGWYRINVTFTPVISTTASVVIAVVNNINSTRAAAFLANGTSGVYLWGAQLETGNIATAYIPTTNAPVTVPAVIQAQCPELLVENEATNRFLQSQNLSSATWTKTAVINSSTQLAPDGTNTAFGMQDNNPSGFLFFSQNNTIVTNTNYTHSYFIKKSFVPLTFYSGVDIFSSGNNIRIILNNYNGTAVTSQSGTATLVSTKIEDYVDYYRVSITYKFASNTSIIFYHYPAISTNGTTTNVAAQGINIYWGFQNELGNKATSYIPTTTAIVTRPADNVRNNTIGYDNEESTIFVRARLNFTTDYQGIATLWDGDDIYNGYITMYYYISGGVRYLAFDTYNGSDTNQYLYTAPSDGVYSIAFAYNTTSGGYKIAINGVLITDDAFPNDLPSYTLLTQITLGSFLTYFNSRTKGFMYFDSMLDNDSLENLTVQ